MQGVFSKIIAGEIPSYKVYEDEYCFAFLDINPNAVGHTLCVTKKEVDKVFELSEKEYNLLMQFSRKVALAIGKAIPCKRVGMSIIGLEVPHVHVHLIPRLKGDGGLALPAMFPNAKPANPPDFAALSDLCRRIKEASE